MGEYIGNALCYPFRSIPAGKLGIYMGIFNFFITLPQIINGLLGGLIVKHIYNDNYIYAIVMAGVFLILAAISVLFVKMLVLQKLKNKHTKRNVK